MARPALVMERPRRQRWGVAFQLPLLVRLTSLIPPQVLTRVNAELDKSGVPVDLTQLKPQHLEDLIEHLDDLTVDLDDANAQIQVFCE